MTNPLVSVLMPCYNASKYIGEAIRSILNQSFQDFELIIYNDGSTDNSLDIIQSIESPKISVISSPHNQGIAYSRNQLIQVAKGKYLAMFDADDVSMPERLEWQVKALEQDAAVGLCGSWVEVIDDYSKTIEIQQHPIDSDYLKTILLFRQHITHSSVMIRKSSLLNLSFYYNTALKVGVDFDLAVRLADYCQFVNIPKVLCKVHQHPQRSTATYLQLDGIFMIYQHQIQKLGIHPSQEELHLHHQAVNIPYSRLDIAYLRLLNNWLIRLWQANQISKAYSPEVLRQILQEIWLKNMAGNSKLGWRFGRLFAESPLSPYSGWGRGTKLRFWLKCALHLS
jgi:glycosyltransferase involved in cell wall biosynthesis